MKRPTWERFAVVRDDVWSGVVRYPGRPPRAIGSAEPPLGTVHATSIDGALAEARELYGRRIMVVGKG